MATTQPKAAKAVERPGKISVRSRRGGTFWRAGRQWREDEQIVSLADLTPEQEQVLRDEPALLVLDVAETAPAAPAAA